MKFRYIWTALVAVMVALGVTTSATAFADELRDIPECADDNDNDGDGLTDCDDTNGDEDCTATKQCNNGGAAGSTDDPVCANDACMEAHLKRFHSLNAFKREVQKHLHTSLETDACDWFTDDGVTST